MQRSALFCTCLAGLVAAALFACPVGALAATTVTGTVKDATGTVLASGEIWFQLSQEGIVTDPAILITRPVKCDITAGVILAPGGGACSLRGNDEISPAGTVYRVRILSSTGRIFLPERTYSITGATWDIGTQTPNPSSVQTGIHGESLHSGDVIPAANQEFGAFYSDLGEIAVPANPGANVRRLFVNSATGELSVRTSAGVTVSLEAAAGGGGSWSGLTDPAAVVVLNSDAIAELFQTRFTANYGATDILLDFQQLTGNPLAGSVFMKLTVNDPDMLPFAISDGTNTVFQVGRDGNTTLSRPTAGTIVLALDAVLGGANDRAAIEFLSAGTKKSEMVMDLNAGSIWEVKEDVVGGVARIRFISIGASRYWSGPTDTAANKHHEFFSLASSGASTLRYTLHGDADKISLGSAADVSLERTSDPNTVLGIAITAGSVFGLPVVAGDPNTATWGTGQDGRAWFNSTSNLWRGWDGSAIQTIGPGGAGDGVGYDEVLEEASGLTKRAQINFIGVDVTAIDNAGATRTDVTIIPVAEAYDAAGWNADTGAASKDNIRDKIESLGFTDLGGTASDAQVDGSLEADELVLAGDVDGAANANDLDELAVEAELEAVLDLADLQEKDIDSLTGQANWGAAVTKETADIIINGVEVDYEAGAAEGFPRLAQSTTPPALACDVAAEAGRLYFDTDADTDGSVFVCLGAAGWKEIDDDGAAGGAPTNAQYVVGASDPTLTAEKILTDGIGIDTVISGGDAGAATIDLKYTDTLAGNPTFAAKICVFVTEGASGGGFLCEGSVGANTNEQLHLFPALDGVDTTDFIAIGASDGDALAGDTATGFFDAGLLEAVRGGTNIDSSGSTGFARVAAGTWSFVAAGGVGTCGANLFETGDNDNAAPTCTQPAFSNLSGTATDGQVPDNITIATQDNNFSLLDDLDNTKVLAFQLSLIATATTRTVTVPDANGEMSLLGQTIGTAELENNAVNDTKLRDSAATSVIGRSAGTTGDPADIAAALDGQVLRRAAGVVGFGALDLADTDAVTGLLPDANVAASISRDTEAPGAADIGGSLSAGYTIDPGAVASPELATANKQFTITMILDSPAVADDALLQHKFSQAVTVQRISCSTNTGTVTVQFDERAEATPNTSGTDVMTSTLVADSDTEATTTFTNAGIAADVPFSLDIDAVASSPGVLRCHIDVQID